MAKVFYYCSNDNCSNFEKEIPYTGKRSYVMRNGHLHLIDRPSCSVCGSQCSLREEVEKQEGPITLNIGEFAGMDPQSKASVLKKRYRKHNEKIDIEGRIKEKKEKTIKKFLGE